MERTHIFGMTEGGKLPPWRSINIRCHDFRVDFCTRAYYAGVPIKTLQSWMGHADASLILKVYTKLTEEQEKKDAEKFRSFLSNEFDAPDSNRNTIPA